MNFCLVKLAPELWLAGPGLILGHLQNELHDQVLGSVRSEQLGAGSIKEYLAFYKKKGKT